MSQTTANVLSTLEVLGSGRLVTSAELAERFNVSRRTVRRYIDILQENGFPVEAVRGRYGGYRLDTGWTPTAPLSDDEVAMLTIGLLAARGTSDDIASPVPASALSKLESALPRNRRDQLRALASSLHFAENPAPRRSGRGGAGPRSGWRYSAANG